MPSPHYIKKEKKIAKASFNQLNHAALKNVWPLFIKRLAQKLYRISSFITKIPPKQAHLREDIK